MAMTGSMLLGVVGCSDLPGNKETQGAVIGGVAGAAAGALVGGSDNRLLGGLIGGALGAGGGYLVGSHLDKADSEHSGDAVRASEQAQKSPATAEQARRASTADVNGDGYVTMDEVVAMHKAGLSDDVMIRRLERTNMFFDLSSQQQQYLRDNGVSDRVVSAMSTVNPEVRAKAEQRMREQTSTGSQTIGSGR
jgi:hypothetical protein